LFDVVNPATLALCIELPAPLAVGLKTACQVDMLIIASWSAGWAITDLSSATQYTNFIDEEATCHLHDIDPRQCL